MTDLRSYIRAAVVPSPNSPPANGGRYALRGDILLLSMPPSAKEIARGAAPGDGRNEALVLGPASVDALFACAADFFGAGTQFTVELDAEAAPDVEAALRTRGWQLDEEEPALVYVLSGTPEEAEAALPAPPDGFAIRQVTSEADLEAFSALSRTSPRYLPSLAAATAPGTGVFVGSVDGTDVATARVRVRGSAPRVADINGVTTHPDYRRRGYGTAMTWETVRFGIRHGAHAAVLTATPMGLPVYRKMGFVPVCTIRTFEPPQ